jgi:hypothetical protein
MLIRSVLVAAAAAYCASAADPFSLAGIVINTTNPEKPAAAPVQMVFTQGGTCEVTISAPLVGSGSCAIKALDEKTGRIEITSVGAVTILWTGSVKGNFVSGTYRIDAASQSGTFYLAVGAQNGATSRPSTLQAPRAVPAPATGCTPAIESTISGTCEGWSGETVFKLDNGQIWQQAEYDYTYSYAYRPTVTIYQTRAGCRMKVEDEDETLLVKRIK